MWFARLKHRSILDFNILFSLNFLTIGKYLKYFRTLSCGGYKVHCHFISLSSSAHQHLVLQYFYHFSVDWHLETPTSFLAASLTESFSIVLKQSVVQVHRWKIISDYCATLSFLFSYSISLFLKKKKKIHSLHFCQTQTGCF